jgi:hypothetical protein
MKMLTLAAAAAFTMGPSLAPDASAATVCTRKWGSRPAADGTMRTVCLDGKYSSCIRDGVAVLGRSPESVKRFCDNLLAQGKLR